VLGLHSQLDKHFLSGKHQYFPCIFPQGAKAFLCPRYEREMVKEEKPYRKVRGEAIPYTSPLVYFFYEMKIKLKPTQQCNVYFHFAQYLSEKSARHDEFFSFSFME
jgi:hypothetical protein